MKRMLRIKLNHLWQNRRPCTEISDDHDGSIAISQSIPISVFVYIAIFRDKKSKWRTAQADGLRPFRAGVLSTHQNLQASEMNGPVILLLISWVINYSLLFGGNFSVNFWCTMHVKVKTRKKSKTHEGARNPCGEKRANFGLARPTKRKRDYS